MFNNVVTKSDFLNYFGINLDLELPNGDNANNKVERFIWRVETYCNNILLKYNHQTITDNNIQRYKNGVMLMMNHTLNVGFENLKGFTDEAFNEFRMGGFCNVPKGVLYG